MTYIGAFMTNPEDEELIWQPVSPFDVRPTIAIYSAPVPQWTLACTVDLSTISTIRTTMLNQRTIAHGGYRADVYYAPTDMRAIIAIDTFTQFMKLIAWITKPKPKRMPKPIKPPTSPVRDVMALFRGLQCRCLATMIALRNVRDRDIAMYCEHAQHPQCRQICAAMMPMTRTQRRAAINRRNGVQRTAAHTLSTAEGSDAVWNLFSSMLSQYTRNMMTRGIGDLAP